MLNAQTSPVMTDDCGCTNLSLGQLEFRWLILSANENKLVKLLEELLVSYNAYSICAKLHI